MTKKQTNQPLLPKLRFSEFQNDGEWKEKPLDSISKRIRRKVGEKKLTPVSITAGLGFVDQTKKFGRKIAGQQYKNYIHIERGDFVYNKGNSKTFAQGCIYELREFEEAAASTAFICFKLNEGCVSQYFQSLFECNTHGRKLRKFITSGARSDGLLNISPTDFFSIELPLPPKKEEQQKIAECLGSLDELIAAHEARLAALQDHKKGLLQQLFPAEGQTTPTLRFPEFQNAGEWEEESLLDIFSIQDGFAFSSTDLVDVSMDARQVIRITDINNRNSNADKVYFPNHKAKELNLSRYVACKGDLLLSLTGAAGFNFFIWEGEESFLNQRTAKLTPKLKKHAALVRLLDPLIHGKINHRGEGQNNNLSRGFLSTVSFPIPEPKEQQRIADCLSSLDGLITAQAEQIAALKEHKKGLMQQLFPSPEARQVSPLLPEDVGA